MVAAAKDRLALRVPPSFGLWLCKRAITLVLSDPALALLIARKNLTRLGALSNPLNLKKMTYVMNFSAAKSAANRSLRYYTVEIVTFDGEHYTEEIEACSEEEAMRIAASLYDNVDYTMIQGSFSWD